MSDQTGVEAAPAESAPEATSPTVTEGTTTQDTQGQGFEPLLERFGALEQRLEAALAPPEPEQEVADPYSGLGELGYSEEETAATRGVLEDIIGQATAPLQQELQRLRSELDYGDLEERHPALQTPEGSEAAMQASASAASDIARSLGLDPSVAQQLAMSPKLIELAHLASVGQRAASQERPAGQPGAELEQPGGASPPEPEPDVNASILGASQKGNFWSL